MSEPTHPLHPPHVLIRASAGTGKTWTLTNRFIALLLAGEPAERILASTFTRKAAGEILERVLLRLARAAIQEKDLSELRHALKQPGLTQARCRALVVTIVQAMDRLQIGTLDAFFIRVASAFSLDLDLPIGWQIAEETIDENLRHEAVERLLAEDDPELLVQLIRLLNKGECKRAVHDQIMATVSELHERFIETDESAWKWLDPLPTLTPAQIEQAIDAIQDLPLPTTKAGSPNKTWQTNLAKLYTAVHLGDWRSVLELGLIERLNEDEPTFGRVVYSEEWIAALKPIWFHARAEQTNWLIRQNEGAWELLHRFDRCYRDLQRRERRYRFSDVAWVLRQGQTMQQIEDVFYRLDGRIGHILLDEFQDTSLTQWQVIEPLAGEAMSDPSGRRTCLCVGDVKQAIYGWRGGDSGLMTQLDTRWPVLHNQSLVKSYRSAPVIVDLVNRIFLNITDNQALGYYPEAVEQWARGFELHQTALTALPGYAELRVAPPGTNVAEKKRNALRLAAQQVHDLRTAAPHQSIGVLVRKNDAVARMIFYLKQLGIEASEEGGNPLTDSPAVLAILSLLRLADHPGDSAAAYHVAQSPLGSRIGLHPRSPEDPAPTPAAVRTVAEQVRRTLIVDGYGPTLDHWARTIAPDCDARDLRRLMQLVDLAHAYDPDATLRPGDFIRVVESRRIEDPTTAPVRVMTVHKSKGLEFDAVILPELMGNLTGRPPRMVYWQADAFEPAGRICFYVNEKLQHLHQALPEIFAQHTTRVIADLLSVLYVAITRARQAVYMIIPPSEKKDGNLAKSVDAILRDALAPADPEEEPDDGPEPERLWQAGDPQWYAATEAEPRRAILPALRRPVSLSIPPRRTRGLGRRSPSALEGGQTPTLREQMQPRIGDAATRGTVIHAWFESITWLEATPPDPATLDAIAARLAIPEPRRDEYLKLFHQMLDQPEIAAALSPTRYEAQPAASLEVWQERAFIQRQGDQIMQGYIDRVVVGRDTEGRPAWAEVLDFKTDRFELDRLDEKVAFYRPQLDAYCHAVAEMLQLDPEHVRGSLLFLRAGRLVTI